MFVCDTTLTCADMDTSTWKTYTNEKSKFSFKYPSTVLVSEYNQVSSNGEEISSITISKKGLSLFNYSTTLTNEPNRMNQKQSIVFYSQIMRDIAGRKSTIMFTTSNNEKWTSYPGIRTPYPFKKSEANYCEASQIFRTLEFK